MAESPEQIETSDAAPSLGERIQSAFAEAVDLPTLARAAFIAALRERDATVADEVESLLRFHSRGGEGAAIADAPTTALPASLVGSTIGGCRLERVLGSGGMSIVYAATQDFPRRSVAVKIVRRERLGESARRRLRVEAEALARLEHPNIARVYAAGSERIGSARISVDDPAARGASDRRTTLHAHAGNSAAPTGSVLESPYIVMELVDNAVPLTKWADAARLDASARIAVVATIADAVEHAHRAGVIHRDLKPGNVVVGTDGTPKVIDFGIAAVANATVTLATDGPMGTLAYMSPEQASGTTVDTRSDIWGLGALLYDMLAGVPPFDTRDASLAQHLDRLLNDAPEPVARAALSAHGASFVESIPAGTDDVLRKALATDADRRYRSASELADELRRLVRGEPLLARPDGEWDALRRLMRRHRRSLTAACGVAAAVVAALVVALTLLSRERQAHRRADWSSYVAAVSAASAMIERNDASAADDMLSHAPEDLRGWEWRHLAPRCDQTLAERAFSDTQQVYGTGWSHDGTAVLAAASSIGAAIDAASGRELWRFRVTHRDNGLNQPLWRAAGLPDGRSIFARLADSILIADARGEIVAEAYDPSIYEFALDQAKARVFTTIDGGFAEWSLSDLSEIRRVKADPPLRGIARTLAVSPDAQTVYLGDMSGGLTAIDTTTGAVRWSWRIPADTRGVSEELRGLGISRDGARIVACSGSYLVVFDAQTGTTHWQQRITGRGYRFPRFSTDGREVTVATWVETVDRHDARDGKRIASIAGAFSQVWSAEHSPDGRFIAAGSLSTRVQVFPSDASDTVPAIAIDGSAVTSVDARDRVFATTADGSLVEIDRRTLAVRHLDLGGLHANAVRLIVAPEARRSRRDKIPPSRSVGLFVAHQRGVARFALDAPEGLGAKSWDQPLEFEPLYLRSLHGGRYASATGHDPRIIGQAAGTTYLLDGSSGAELHAVPLRGRDARPMSETGDPDILFVPAGQAGVTQRLHLSIGELHEQTELPEYPLCALLSPDRTRLAVGSVLNSGEVTFLDPFNLAMKTLMPNHRGGVRALAWTRDSERLATLASDDTVRVWHAEQATEMLTLWRGNAAELAFDDDDTLWVACADGALRVFRAPDATDSRPSR